jgi:hypothetical protein
MTNFEKIKQMSVEDMALMLMCPADVEIMLEQCKIMFQCDKEVNKWKQKKIERLERRLEGGN